MTKTNTDRHAIPAFTQQYLIIIAGVTLLLGLCLVIAPSLVSNMLFEVQHPASTFFVRMLGSTLIGYGTLNFLAIRDGSLRAYKLAVSANLVTLAVATLITVGSYNLFTGFAWLAIGQHFLFATGFAICYWQLYGLQRTAKPRQSAIVSSEI